MPFSSGTFSLYTPGNPVVTGTTIEDSWANNTLDDIATGLSTAVLKDGTQTCTASVPFAEGLSSAKLVDISGANAGQIQFPATANPSANANTLDDYEEGTFTIVIQGSGGAGVGTYTSQIGRYIKIGKCVHVTGYMVWTAHTGAGNIEIGGLPFTVINTTSPFTAMPVMTSNVALSASHYCCGAYPAANAVYLNVLECVVGGGASSPITLDTAGELWLGGHYESTN